MTGWTRTASTLLGAALAGALLWLAAQIGRHTTGGYWAAYGIVAAAGLVLALSQLRGRGGNPQGTFLLAFVPVFVVAGWILIAMQPHSNWFRSHALAWSGDIGVRDVVHDVGTWLGVLALGIGFVFGVALEPGLLRRRRREPEVAPQPVPEGTTAPAPAPAPAPASAPPPAEAAANEPLADEPAE
jgi:hypothetical protein